MREGRREGGKEGRREGGRKRRREGGRDLPFHLPALASTVFFMGYLFHQAYGA